MPQTTYIVRHIQVATHPPGSVSELWEGLGQPKEKKSKQLVCEVFLETNFNVTCSLAT